MNPSIMIAFSFSRFIRLGISLAMGFSSITAVSWAQEAVEVQSGIPRVTTVAADGTPVAPPTAGPKMRKVKGPDGQVIEIPDGVDLPPGFSLVEDAKPTDEAKKDGKPAAVSGGATPVKRSSEPPDPPDRKEFEVKPDDEGMIQFQFRNQPWPDLLRWLAEVSSMSLDWQELPGDYINLATQRKYKIEEARDLFNRQLLTRGFTMLEFEGLIQVVKVEGINPAMVPMVTVGELATLPPFRFVRTSFPLETLLAEEMVAELQGMMSTHGKLRALSNTNRLDAMDTVANLREIHRVLKDEQSEESISRMAKEYSLNYVRAADVKMNIEVFLGIKSMQAASGGGEMGPEQMMMQQQMMQQMMQMQQMQQQQQQPAGPGAKKKSGEVYLIANVRKNSIIVHAPPDKRGLIEALIKRIDVEGNSPTDLQTIESRMKVYRLASLDPEKLVKALQAMDALEPTTRLEVDKDHNAIIAYASVADHLTIAQVLKRLDGSARQFDVLQLRRLRADEVAGTIKFMMGSEEKKDDKSSRRRFYYYDPFGQNDDKKKNNDQFRVGANNQDNQLLIWANEAERAEINKLLIKLGELPPEGGRQSPYRVIDAARTPATYEYLKRLQERWNQMSPNELVLPSPEEFEDSDELESLKEKAKREQESSGDSNKEGRDAKEEKAPADPNKAKAIKNEDEITGLQSIPAGILASMTQPPSNSLTREKEDLSSAEGNDDDAAPMIPKTKPRDRAAKKSPIQISVDAKGNLVLFSTDPAALDQLEMLMQEVAPPKKSYDVFVIKHRRASWIKLSLEDYFKDEEKKKNNNDGYLRWIFDLEPETEKKDDPQLGGKRKLRFLSDNETSKVIAIGADDATREVIKGLIATWDVAEPPNKNEARFTKMIKIKYSRAESIAEAIKDAYRDLLSSKDKTFQENNAKGANGAANESNRLRSPNFDSISDGSISFGGFSGKLSLGVEKITNTLVVTAEGEDLLNVFSEMITELDNAAKPSNTVQVVRLDGATNIKSLEKAIKGMMKTARPQSLQPGQQPGQPNAQQVQQQIEAQQRGNDE